MADAIFNRTKIPRNERAVRVEDQQAQAELHPAWQAVIRFCREMGYGEIACLRIHDGLPISADVVTKKIRWY